MPGGPRPCLPTHNTTIIAQGILTKKNCWTLWARRTFLCTLIYHTTCQHTTTTPTQVNSCLFYYLHVVRYMVTFHSK